MATISKYLFTFFGMLVALLEPTVPFIVICTLAVLMDCYTAWALSRRVKKKYPGANDGKFKSKYAGKVFVALIKIYAIILLGHLIDIYVFPETDLNIADIVVGAICFWQIWSMLENESSCNDAKWAKLAQKIMVDKTARHFDIDLSDLQGDENKNDEPEKITENGRID